MRSILWLSLAAFFLTSCATNTPAPRTAAPTQIPWKNREQTLSQLQSWQISGKIGVQTAKDAGSATINWSQRHQQYAISLTGPLGANGLRLVGQPGRVTMTTANGKQFTASSPEKLLSQHWGFYLPVSAMQYWIRGMPVPGIPSNSRFDSYHRLSDLTQQGTHIQYMGYTNRNGMELPQKIYITSPSITAKIVIYEWNT